MAARRKRKKTSRRTARPHATRASKDNRNIVVLASILIIGVAAYFLYTAQVAEQEARMKLEEMRKTVNVTLSAQNNSQESGSAALKEVNGQVVVTLNLTGEPKGAVQPAHIHLGSCPNPGAIKYPLTNVVDGKSETTLNVTMDKLRSELPLAVNVHKSAAQSKVYVSCGNLPT